MPIYNDNRMNLGYVANRTLIVEGFRSTLSRNFIGYDVFAGTSTAGIPWTYILSDKEKVPLIYVRDKPKDRGLKNRIEGIDNDKDLENKKVVLFEDIVSTGGSSVSAVQGIRDAKGDIDNCLCIFSYELDPAMQMFDAKIPYDVKNGTQLEKPCKLWPLLTYEELLGIAKETGYINADQVKVLEEWRGDPFRWGENHGFPPVKK
jgi:orotate phosphoribosyltransferase